ncbi:hypothetical protein [Nostoc sp.]|uniref:hypothetical protein n=1 Tax=Nostoc sp. TaxID=1180 RepID=UPI002FF7E550
MNNSKQTSIEHTRSNYQQFCKHSFKGEGSYGSYPSDFLTQEFNVDIQLDISAEMRGEIKGILDNNPDAAGLETAYQQYIQYSSQFVLAGITDLTATSFHTKQIHTSKYSAGEFI